MSAKPLESSLTIVESVCPNCQENGETRMILVDVPHFKEMVVASFECEQCGTRNRSIDFTRVAEYGCCYTVHCKTIDDLDRQIVRSQHACVKLMEHDIEWPTESEINTIEGLLQACRDNLVEIAPQAGSDDQVKLTGMAQKLTNAMEHPNFHLMVDDPAGNSYVQSTNPTGHDPQLEIKHYIRSKGDDYFCALTTYDDAMANEKSERVIVGKGKDAPLHLPPVKDTVRTCIEEAVVDRGELPGTDFEQPCAGCKRMGLIKICQVDIPHFKDLVIMSFKCDHCGFTSNDITSGGEIRDYGTTITLKVEEPLDLCRDVVVSQHCTIQIPDLEIELNAGANITTVEGLLAKMLEDLTMMEQRGFLVGDSATDTTKDSFTSKIQQLEHLRNSDRPFTLILDDPLAQTWVKALGDDPKKLGDERLTVLQYTRTEEQDEDFGITALREQDVKDKASQ